MRVPRLPDLGIEPRLGGTQFPQAVGVYVCGITPYDATHLGHAHTYLTFDVLVRLLRASGRRVTHVQNVTDVDDPLLERAIALGVDWRYLAREGIDRLATDMEALRVLSPDHYVGVVESVPLIVDGVTRLLRREAAYRIGVPDQAGEGAADVYADTRAETAFAEALPDDAVELFGERGGDPARPGKRAPLDPLLWRAGRSGEPTWDGGPLGPGRPGWHIECAVIAEAFLGGAPTITGGGSDLAFPHHHMTASHLRALGHPHGGLALHVGLVGLDGEKMSKSRGNLVFVSRLLEDGADPAALRLALAAHHWSREWQWDRGQLRAAEHRLARWRAAALVPAPAGGGAPLAVRVARALAGDLDVPAALAEVDAWAGAVLAGAGGDDGAADAVDALLGIDLRAQELSRRRR